jgi:chemotaxis protein CheC
MPFTAPEVGVLQSIMAAAFDRAATELGNVAGVSIELRTPTARVVKIPDLSGSVLTMIPDIGRRTVVEQEFRGQSDGDALLIFPAEAGTLFKGLLAPDDEGLEDEALMEIGNVLIGACTGRLFEMLSRTIYYLPPRILPGSEIVTLVGGGRYAPEDFAIMLKAHFGVAGEELAGDMLLVNRRQSIPDLKMAIESYQQEHL